MELGKPDLQIRNYWFFANDPKPRAIHLGTPGH